MDELKRNTDIEIDKETLSFHFDACLREHEEIYGIFVGRSLKVVKQARLIRFRTDIESYGVSVSIKVIVLIQLLLNII